MNTKAERLRVARSAAGFKSTQAAADRMGVSASTYRAHENGQNDFSDDQAAQYAKAFGIDPAELIFGRKRSPLVNTFDPDAPDSADRDDEMTVGEHTGAQGVPPGSIPQIDVTAGMGGGGITIVREGVAGKGGMTFSAEVVRDFWRIPTEVLRSVGASPDFLAVLPVQGDSMLPTLHDGEWVVADTRHRWPSPDGIYALNDAFGGVVVKRLEVVSKPSDEVQRVQVISDNPRHAPKEWDFEDLRIIGRVIWRFGNLQ